MENYEIILLYSKYSQHSNSILKLISTTNLNITKLCIDNNDVRKLILKSNNIIIKYVPCILIIFSNGKIEKYEGSKAFQLVNELTTQIQDDQSIQTENIKQEDEDNISTDTQQTLIENLDIKEDNDIVENDDFFPPKKASLRTGVGSYQREGDFGKKKSETKIKKGIKNQINETLNSVNPVKGDIMSAALAMQKSREQEIKPRE